MAITLPSDIVSDVARAADPARYQAAAQKLTAGAGAVDGAGFENAIRIVSAHRAPSGGADIYALRNSLRNNAETAGADKSKQIHQEFEAYVLQTFVESMIPKDAEETFGKGTAGSVWRSMLAEQIGTQISKAGGIGIAERILGRSEYRLRDGTPAPKPAESNY